MNQADREFVEPEIRAERDYMVACRAALARMRGEVERMLRTGAADGDAIEDKVTNTAMRRWRANQVEELSDIEGVPLFFGRLDYPPDELRDSRSPASDPDRDRVYIGRRGVSDEAGELMVIDWRAPLSSAFYEASHQDSRGVRVRRRYGFDRDGMLSAFEDESLAHQIASASGLLAAEIERPRKGPMRDIVATIQPEQMSLVRAPMERTLCIQGAPGTGKTAVGLHRLAYLLFSERERLRTSGGVAVIGPNRSFLAYVRNVLPALGEVEVSQTTIDELIDPERIVDRIDDPDVARIKGDTRMAEVIGNHLWSRVQPSEQTLEVKHQHRTWRLYPEELADELDAVRGRGTSYHAGLELLTQRLAYLVLRHMERAGHSTGADTLRQLGRAKAIRHSVGLMWPKVDPARLIFELLTDQDQLGRAADGILTEAEQQAMLRIPRPRSVKAMTWSSPDLALLDEAAALVERPARLGHIVVDEAQDLSAMQIRAIARRAAGSCTVLGDLAQATGPAAVRDWSTLLTHLDKPDGKIEELTRGYRVPAQIIDFAARLLPHIAPELRGPASFRQSDDALRLTETAPAELTAAVVNACATALSEEGSIGLIAADADIPWLQDALMEAGLPHTVLGAETASPDTTPLTLAPVTLAKGLEFDTVVVVEPARIAEAEQRGLQRLYVALTRAVSTLHIVHAADLPEPLA
ncbi:HelD family protein [Nocardia altamirensis]|uniref:HelD family protein n=1 Tax=Nocardia altamirensis TaxID=472158 RepID=UPI00084052B0|nr:ATP-binding domain-containing protein [Nocardia altamirensis]